MSKPLPWENATLYGYLYRLKTENAQLQAQVERLKAETERLLYLFNQANLKNDGLREAGDELWYCLRHTKRLTPADVQEAVEDWIAAKEGRPNE